MTLAFGAEIVTRFAPSPTGLLHLGHAHSALLGHRVAHDAGGRFLLRIEDIDRTRCKPEFETAIFDDLHWLGLDWEEPVRRQSDHFADYAAALQRLEADGLIYPCFCSRKDIAAAASAPHEGETVIYPGTCRGLDPILAAERKASAAAFALRLDVAKAARRAGPLAFLDAEPDGSNAREIRAEPERFGDVVLGRRDTPASYHLCATLDDHLQGVTLVIRGEDLRPATHLHRLLQAVLGLATPQYRHHVLLRNESGVRLSKRDGAMALRALRDRGVSANAVRKMAGFQDA
ncbi:tRNA glutamyl-Q(34) synthetase GluQRS [Dongia sedimenti]|uniref:tRNA glutamyl-Q(34) synthetase GluQRS n=1 Tax=Dongia sedimenti TaxID=3064282 RepID=A0ABU0YP70_9PROT|nr:tRNA glutamyl-Q(34) synthetase GluQRS [Rhodospirillaceae bacterium R-7]